MGAITGDKQTQAAGNIKQEGGKAQKEANS